MTEERDGWKRGPVEVAGEYWRASEKEMAGELPWEPDLKVMRAGEGFETWWYKLREIAPPRPELPEPKIGPIAGRWYVARYHGCASVEYAFFSEDHDGAKLESHARVGHLDHWEILAEVPSPEEYLKQMENEK